MHISFYLKSFDDYEERYLIHKNVCGVLDYGIMRQYLTEDGVSHQSDPENLCLSHRIRQLTACIDEKKSKFDQRPCFRSINCAISLLPKTEISCLLLLLFSLVCLGPGRKHRLLFF